VRYFIAAAIFAFLLVACVSVPSQQEASVQGVTNGYRVSVGSQREGWSNSLQADARAEVEYIASIGAFVHSSMQAQLAKYPSMRACGENLAYGPAGYTAEQVVTAWENSPEHDINLRLPDFRLTGVASVTVGGRTWYAAEYCG
jgi:uncharacterized protein YkwD